MNGETKETGIYGSVRKRLKEIQGASIDVGYFPESKAKGDSDLYVAEYAFWNDHGVPGRIHERPFLSTVLKENKFNYSRISKVVAFDALAGKISVKKALSKIGAVIVSDVKLKITEFRTPANALSTQKAKGKRIGKGRLVDNPLIDEGHMRKSTKYKVNV